jgi:Holliday junction resolvasome RuvABC DNA-binding subunit
LFDGSEESVAPTHVPSAPRARIEPLSEAPPAPRPHVIELALRGLNNMGFSKPDARRAVDHVSQRVAKGNELDVQDLLRGAIGALT